MPDRMGLCAFYWLKMVLYIKTAIVASIFMIGAASGYIAQAWRYDAQIADIHAKYAEQEAERHRAAMATSWQEGEHRRAAARSHWQEMLRLRAAVAAHWQQAEHRSTLLATGHCHATPVRLPLRPHWQQAMRPHAGVSRPPMPPVHKRCAAVSG